MTSCIFCSLDPARIISSNDLAVAFEDLYPVSKNHTLIIPKKHCKSFFDLFEDELLAIHELLCDLQEAILAVDPSVTGLNVGCNVGKSSGQSVDHCHFHMIPRREGDVEEPFGGVRNVIPNKCDYRQKS